MSFLWGQLSIFAKLVSDGCRVSRLLVFVKLVVLVAVVRFVTARSLIFLVIRFVAFVIGFVAFVVRFVVIVVRLVLSGVGLFVEVFPMMGIDVMCKGLHFVVLEASLADP